MLHLGFYVFVGIVGIAVTLISILTTGINIWQNRKNRDEIKKATAPTKDSGRFFISN